MRTGTRGSARVRSRSTNPGGDRTMNGAAPDACTDSTVAPKRDTAARPIATASTSSPRAKSSTVAGCGSTNSAPAAPTPISRQRCSARVVPTRRRMPIAAPADKPMRVAGAAAVADPRGPVSASSRRRTGRKWSNRKAC